MGLLSPACSQGMSTIFREMSKPGSRCSRFFSCLCHCPLHSLLVYDVFAWNPCWNTFDWKWSDLSFDHKLIVLWPHLIIDNVQLVCQGRLLSVCLTPYFLFRDWINSIAWIIPIPKRGLLISGRCAGAWSRPFLLLGTRGHCLQEICSDIGLDRYPVTDIF